MKLSPFHLAIPVDDVAKARAFYTQTLKFEEGRSSDHWVDYNFFGHQLVIHYKPKQEKEIYTNPVDGKDVPVPHFGVVLDWEQFWEFADNLKAAAIEFIIPPYIFDLKEKLANKLPYFSRIPVETPWNSSRLKI